jgi:hypothetical protein
LAAWTRFGAEILGAITYDARVAQTSALDVISAMADAWRGQNYDRLATLLHPEGAWEFVGGGGVVITDPKQLIDAIRAANRDTAYHLGEFTFEQLGDTTVLACTSARLQHGRQGHSHRPVFFLCEVRDDRFYRSQAFSSAEAARTAFSSGW